MILDALGLGATAGFASTVLMILFEFPFWRSLGTSGVVEWEVNQIFVSRILGQEHDPKGRLKEALAMHLLHGTVAGAALAAVLFYFLPGARTLYWLAGLVLSLLLWSIVPFVFRGSIESAGKVIFSRTGLLVSLLSHVVCGTSSGLTLQALL